MYICTCNMYWMFVWRGSSTKAHSIFYCKGHFYWPAVLNVDLNWSQIDGGYNCRFEFSKFTSISTKTSFTSTKVKLRLRFTWPSSDHPLTLTRPLPNLYSSKKLPVGGGDRWCWVVVGQPNTTPTSGSSFDIWRWHWSLLLAWQKKVAWWVVGGRWLVGGPSRYRPQLWA